MRDGDRPAAGAGERSVRDGVPFFDLTAQYRGIRDEVRAALEGVLESQAFILGPPVAELEEAVAGSLGLPHAVGCASGTDALLLTLRALEPAPGDEAIVPAFTFFATAGAAWNAGFRPVFCDVDPATFNATAETVAAAWSPRTRVVIPVHLFGQMAPVEEIAALARERGAFVLEDAAQAFGAWREAGGERLPVGGAGGAAALSFFPTKNLGGFGDGGMVVTRDGDLAERLRKLRVHGGRKMYRHELVGTNSRLDALQAAVLRVKLRHVPAWIEARRRHAAVYDGLLAGVEGVRTPAVLPGNHHVYNQYTIRARNRDGLRDHLRRAGIGSGVYYPAPLHLQPCFRELGYRRGDLPQAEALAGEVLSLPVFPELGEAGATRVAEAVRAFYGG